MQVTVLPFSWPSRFRTLSFTLQQLARCPRVKIDNAETQLDSKTVPANFLLFKDS